MIRLLIALFLLLSVFQVKAQRINLDDTVYYRDGGVRCKKRNADYYRPPVIKDGNHYHVKYYKIEGYLDQEKLCLPKKYDYHLSIEPNSEINDGYFRSYTPKGYLYAEGNYENGFKVGDWNFYHYDTKVLRTQYSYYKNQPFVYKTAYSKDSGSKIYEGTLIRTFRLHDTVLLKDGVWTYYYQNSPRIKLVANYKGSLLHGDFTYYDSATMNKLCTGSYYRHVKHGEWKYYDSTGMLVSTEHRKLGRLDGETVLYHAGTSEIYHKMYFEEGKCVGVWKSYFQSTGKLRGEIDYTKGKSEVGYAVSYDSATGAKEVEGEVYQTIRHGKWRRYDLQTGKLIAEEFYKNNLLHDKVIAYDNDGNVVSEVPYEDGKINGKVIYYYPGKKEKWVEMEYEDNEYNGSVKSYYSTGKVKRKGFTKVNGDRVEECYAPNGQKIECGPFIEKASFEEDVMTYIGNHLRYPPEAKEARLEGKVTVGFMIEESGRVSDVYVIEGFDSRCDEEARRLVNEMPLWNPFMVDGVPVKINHKLSIVFWLPEKTDETSEDVVKM